MHFLTSLSTIATLLHASRAFKSITVGTSYNISANSPIPVQITNDANDAQAVNFTIGLYTTAGNSPICTLVDSIPIKTTAFDVTIPPSVGPEGFYYRLYAISYSAQGSIIAPFPSYSSPFYLSSANGTLTSLEVLGPVPNQFVAQGFYAGLGSQPPCSSYDCWRQCAKQDPPVFEDNGLGLAQAGQMFYDSRYIECLEACPGTNKSALEGGVDVGNSSVTTTGTGSLPTGSVTNIVASASCDVQGGETFCGGPCCGKGVECTVWGQCASGPVDSGSEPTSTGTASVSATGSAAGSKETGGSGKSAAGRLEVHFGFYGIMALVLVWAYA